MAANAPLTFHQGDDVFYDFVVVEADDVTPINLIGSTVKSQLKKNFNKPVQVEFSVEYTDLANGQFRISLTSAQTASIPFGCGDTDKTSYLYDVQITQQNGQVLTLMRGKVVITREVTS